MTSRCPFAPQEPQLSVLVAPFENRRRQRHEPPEQVEGFGRIRPGDSLDDCPALDIEIIGKGSDASWHSGSYLRERPAAEERIESAGHNSK